MSLLKTLTVSLSLMTTENTLLLSLCFMTLNYERFFIAKKHVLISSRYYDQIIILVIFHWCYFNVVDDRLD